MEAASRSGIAKRLAHLPGPSAEALLSQRPKGVGAGTVGAWVETPAGGSVVRPGERQLMTGAGAGRASRASPRASWALSRTLTGPGTRQEGIKWVRKVSLFDIHLWTGQV